MKGLLKEAEGLNESISALKKKLGALRADSESRTKKEVLIHKQLFPDALFQIPPQTLLVKDSVKGPLKVVIREGELRLIDISRK